MYCNKTNVNILTALLVEHGIRHVVVCPGSRNAPLVHNFSQCPDLICHPVTDEKSAGFVALGLRQQCHESVAICVTSGSALLNVLPAVAEATYQHQGIIVISADRPAAWIDQLDGQTLPQPHALGVFASLSVSLPEVGEKDATAAWHCNRLVNEAIIANKAAGHPSVHINVPITEPLFEFTVEELPHERIVNSGNWSDASVRNAILNSFDTARRPMVVIGQMPEECAISKDRIASLHQGAFVLSEPVTMEGMHESFTDQMLAVLGSESASYRPDWVLYAGGNTVSKKLRQFLRSIGSDATQILLCSDGKLRDVSQNTSWLLTGNAADVLNCLSAHIDALKPLPHKAEFLDRWNSLRNEVRQRHESFEPAYSHFMAVKLFESIARKVPAQVYYANSMAVRLAAIHARGYCHCNRGVNGIEGSLSVAAGASLAKAQQRVYCVIGDLSFFYDQNALWQQLSGNMRILLLNNGQGGIFRMLPGLEKSPVRDSFVAGSHVTSAEGASIEYGLGYRCATDESSLREGIEWLVEAKSDKPLLLEVKTDPATDMEEFKRYYNHLKIK